MIDRAKEAVERHKKGYNCSQAVVCSYCDLLGIDEAMAFKISEGFGGGMGGMRDTCGAVTGMFMCAGLKGSSGNVDNLTKQKTYKEVKFLAEEFIKMNKSIICRELIGETGKKLRSCDGCIEDAARLVEKFIFNEKTEAEIVAAEEK